MNFKCNRTAVETAYPAKNIFLNSFTVFQVSSSICLLRGKIYDAMGNRPLATSSYKEALKLDVYCFEAFDLLTSHHMLTAQEGKEIVSTTFYYCAISYLLSL